MTDNDGMPPFVRKRDIDWAALVRRTAGEDWNKKEPAYEFSNGRKFDDSGPRSGIYRPEE